MRDVPIAVNPLANARLLRVFFRLSSRGAERSYASVWPHNVATNPSAHRRCRLEEQQLSRQRGHDQPAPPPLTTLSTRTNALGPRPSSTDACTETKTAISWPRMQPLTARRTVTGHIVLRRLLLRGCRSVRVPLDPLLLHGLSEGQLWRRRIRRRTACAVTIFGKARLRSIFNKQWTVKTTQFRTIICVMLLLIILYYINCQFVQFF